MRQLRAEHLASESDEECIARTGPRALSLIGQYLQPYFQCMSSIRSRGSGVQCNLIPLSSDRFLHSFSCDPRKLELLNRESEGASVWGSLYYGTMGGISGAQSVANWLRSAPWQDWIIGTLSLKGGDKLGGPGIMCFIRPSTFQSSAEKCWCLGNIYIQYNLDYGSEVNHLPRDSAATKRQRGLSNNEHISKPVE